MLREQARQGMRVFFGRHHGEKTLGEIIKVNPTKAKVKTLESRGIKDNPPGAVWNVPYSLMEPETGQTSPAHEPLRYDAFNPDNDLLEALARTMADLSPENLTSDGEASAATIAARRTRLLRRQKGLLLALGRENAEEIHTWMMTKREYQRQG